MDVEDSLYTLLHKFKEKIYYFPNQGNAGDSLITAATILYFEKYGIEFEVINPDNFLPINKIIVYGGGGNFGGEQSRAARIINKYYKACKEFIVLPHTVFDVDSTLSNLTANCHIFCREPVSYNYCLSKASQANIYLKHDMVFTCNPSDILNRKVSINLVKKIINKVLSSKDNDFGLSFKGFVLTISHKLWSSKEINRSTLNAFRVDAEKTEIKIPSGNQDLSMIFQLSACDIELSFKSAQLLLTEIDKYDTIRTNRLHVGIGALLMNKHLELHSNNYYKVKAIYDYSIEGYYKNTTWKD